MKVTHVAIQPTEASRAAQRHAMTPELLAASGARYSRNNEGLEAIIARIDPNNLDKSVDSIFRMIDYGHQSIADMAPVAMFIDDISVWLAYFLWTLCPTAGGQESSTRYIRLSERDLLSPEELGIAEPNRDAWHSAMKDCFAAFHTSLTLWEDLVAQDPSLARVPYKLLNDPSDKVQKQVARMQRNYGFDRARYFLPAAISTNVMLVMSARGWVQLCQSLLSHALPEAQNVGKAIQSELKYCVPRLLKHATFKEGMAHGQQQEFATWQRLVTHKRTDNLHEDAVTFTHPATPSLAVLLPQEDTPQDLASDLRFHDNRYAWIGQDIRRTMVRFAWEAVAFAEIRDLNRHRTGTKYCPLIPRGFYAAEDQLPGVNAGQTALLHTLSQSGRRASALALERLQQGDPGFVYWTLLGTQYYFEHTTTADKFLYEAELRTGAGAHYRYADHLHDVLALWYARFPETQGLVLEGSAEPE